MTIPVRLFHETIYTVVSLLLDNAHPHFQRHILRPKGTPKAQRDAVRITSYSDDIDPRPFKNLVTDILSFHALFIGYLPGMYRHLGVRTRTFAFRCYSWIDNQYALYHLVPQESVKNVREDVQSLTFAKGESALGVMSTSGLTFSHSPSFR